MNWLITGNEAEAQASAGHSHRQLNYWQLYTCTFGHCLYNKPIYSHRIWENKRGCWIHIQKIQYDLTLNLAAVNSRCIYTIMYQKNHDLILLHQYIQKKIHTETIIIQLNGSIDLRFRFISFSFFLSFVIVVKQRVIAFDWI